MHPDAGEHHHLKRVPAAARLPGHAPRPAFSVSILWRNLFVSSVRATGTQTELHLLTLLWPALVDPTQIELVILNLCYQRA